MIEEVLEAKDIVLVILAVEDWRWQMAISMARTMVWSTQYRGGFITEGDGGAEKN